MITNYSYFKRRTLPFLIIGVAIILWHIFSAEPEGIDWVLIIVLCIIGIILPLANDFYFALKCPKCKYPYRFRDTFCGNCGIKLP